MQQRLPGKMRAGLCCCPLKFIPTQLSIHTVPWENTAPWAQLQLQSCSQTRTTFKTPGLLSSPPDKISRMQQPSTVKRKELFHAAMTLKKHGVEVKNLSKSRGVCTEQICFPTCKASLKREEQHPPDIMRTKGSRIHQSEVIKLTCRQYFTSNLKNLAFKANPKSLWSHLPAKP